MLLADGCNKVSATDIIPEPLVRDVDLRERLARLGYWQNVGDNTARCVFRDTTGLDGLLGTGKGRYESDDSKATHLWYLFKKKISLFNRNLRASSYLKPS